MDRCTRFNPEGRVSVLLNSVRPLLKVIYSDPPHLSEVSTAVRTTIQAG